jgi:hypothetical protein
MTNVKQVLINRLESSPSIEAFSLAERMLVMYNTGVVKAVVGSEGEPFFFINDKVTNEQINRVDTIVDTIRNAPNDVWNNYVYGGIL